MDVAAKKNMSIWLHEMAWQHTGACLTHDTTKASQGLPASLSLGK